MRRRPFVNLVVHLVHASWLEVTFSLWSPVFALPTKPSTSLIDESLSLFLSRVFSTLPSFLLAKLVV